MSKAKNHFKGTKKLKEVRIQLSEAQNHRCAKCGKSVDPYSENIEDYPILVKVPDYFRFSNPSGNADSYYIVCFTCKDVINILSRQDLFNSGDLWLSPKGILYRVSDIRKDSIKNRIAVLTPKPRGRKVVRPDNATNGWEKVGHEKYSG